MAIGRVPGPALLGNLDRQGTDLSFTTSGTTLVYMDFANFRFGIGNTSPTHSLTVNGDVLVYNGTANISNLTLFPGALFDGGANKLTNILDPALAQDAATKAYVDSLVGNQAHIGNAIPLGSAADGSLTTDGAYISWTPNYLRDRCN